jgi:tetratricopeptide (TPR) repeat protein
MDQVSITQWHIMAGDHARRWGAQEEALAHYAAAEDVIEGYLPAATSVSLRITLLLGRANLYLQRHSSLLGLADAELASELAQQENDTFGLIHALILRAEFHNLQGQYTSAGELAGRAAQLAESNHFMESIAQALWVQAQSLQALGRVSEAARLLQRATPYAEQHNSPNVQVGIALDAVQISLKNHARDRAREHIDLAISLGRDLGDPGLLQKVWANYGQTRLLFGEAETACHAFEQTLKLTSAEGSNLAFLGSIVRDYGIALCYLGRYGDAIGMFDTAKNYFAQANDQSEVWHLEVLRAGEVLIDHEKYDPALQILEAAFGSSALGQSAYLYGRLMQAYILIQTGEYTAARQRLEHFPKEADSHNTRWYRPVWHLRMGELALMEEDFKSAVNHAYKALGAVGTQNDLRYLTPIYGLLAIGLQWLESPADSIQDALNRAVKTSQSQARKLHTAQALRLAANYTRNSSTRQTVRARSAGYLYRSSALFTELGLAPRDLWPKLPAAMV